MTSKSVNTVAAFLQASLSRGALPVAELTRRACRKGLLRAEHKLTRQAKFKEGKRALAIVARRDVTGTWYWSLPNKECSMAEEIKPQTGTQESPRALTTAQERLLPLMATNLDAATIAIEEGLSDDCFTSVADKRRFRNARDVRAAPRAPSARNAWARSEAACRIA